MVDLEASRRMTRMTDKIAVFQRRRMLALLGVGAGGLSICFVLLNSQQHLVTQAMDWPLGLLGMTISVITALNYRCPYCGKHPEKGDVAMFDPPRCVGCGARLK